MKIKALIIWNIILTIILLITAYGVGGMRVAFPLMTDRLLHDEELVAEQFEDFQSQLDEQGAKINELVDSQNETIDILENHGKCIGEIQDYINQEAQK